MATALLIPCEAPSVPDAHVGHQLGVQNPGRIAAFVVELDTLFEVPRWERARARAAARRIAALKGLDPLWSEVLALEIATSGGGNEAIDALQVLSDDPGLDAASFRDSLAALVERDGARSALEALSLRFKLACVSSRPRAEAERLLRGLDLAHLFEVVAANEAPGPLGRLIAELGEPGDACVVVAGPTSALLDQARSAGMQTVALLSDGRGQLSAALRADLVLSSFELVEALGAGADAKYASH